jgi:hypothetical protein
VPILLLSSRYSADSIALRDAAVDMGWSVERLIDVEQVEKFKAQTALVIFGEAVFARVVAQVLGVGLLQPPLDWLAQLPFAFVQRRIRYVTLHEARSQQDLNFIKPAGEKAFPAKIYASGAELPNESSLSDTTPVLIIEPVIWELEYRCFVLDREPTTVSIYKRGGRLARDKDGFWNASSGELGQAWDYARNVLSRPNIDVPPAFVLDIGIMKNKGWGIIETNPVWASGIYGCEPSKILPVLQRSCRNKDELTAEDSQWLIS